MIVVLIRRQEWNQIDSDIGGRVLAQQTCPVLREIMPVVNILYPFVIQNVHYLSKFELVIE